MTRIIWLRGLEASTARAFSRCIYIHGTAEERTIGRPASYGCIRMKSKDVADLYSQLPVGAVVKVVQDKLPRVAEGEDAISASRLRTRRSNAVAQRQWRRTTRSQTRRAHHSGRCVWPRARSLAAARRG